MSASLVRALLPVYDLGWKAAMPLLRFNHRLKQGWNQRTLKSGYPAHADVWMQAASGGEAFLAWEVLRKLKAPAKAPLRVLVTTNTLQGMEILERAAAEINGKRNGLAVQPWYFPFDAPSLMDDMTAHVRPRLAVILETEIWPGFLSACKKRHVPVLLANGRMTPKSLGGYLAVPGLFRELAPALTLAVSEADASRFATLFGRNRVATMPNIKFDRMVSAGPMARKDNPLRDLLPPETDFVVFGSVRKEEEEEVAAMARGLMRSVPGTVLGLFPRHMHRVDSWKTLLDGAGLNWKLRSELSGPATPGTVIIWDVFGEMLPAYGLAKAAFVGGSLAPLGGQNFLEPMTCGVIPVIGPHWKNFAWVGREVIDQGLAVEARNHESALSELLEILKNPTQRATISTRARTYIGDRLGGAETVCKHIAQFLDNV